MIGSRAVGLLKNLSRCSTNKQQIALTNLLQVRHSGSGWNYRTLNEPEPWAKRGALCVYALAWWWFYWNLYHGWSHVVGLHDGKPIPNGRYDWSDEELGIPADTA